MRIYARSTKRERSSWRTSGRRAASWPTTRPSRRNRGKGLLSPRVIWRQRGRLRHDAGKRHANPPPDLPGRLRPLRHLHGRLPRLPRDAAFPRPETGRTGGAAVPFGLRSLRGRLDRTLHVLPPLRHGLPGGGPHLRAEPDGQGEVSGRTGEDLPRLASRPERSLRRAGFPLRNQSQSPAEEPDTPAAPGPPVRARRLFGRRPASALLRHPPSRRRGPPRGEGDGEAEHRPAPPDGPGGDRHRLLFDELRPDAPSRVRPPPEPYRRGGACREALRPL